MEINEAMTHTRNELLENFDDEVREKLRIRDEASKACLNRFERQLMQLTRYELNGHADFISDSSFRLNSHPFSDKADQIPLGLYELPRRTGDAHLYRRSHPLALALTTQAKSRDLEVAEIHFDYGKHDGKISILEPWIGQTGWLKAYVFTIESLDQAEDHLIVTAMTDQGNMLNDEIAVRLLSLPAEVTGPATAPSQIDVLTDYTRQRQSCIQTEISARNARFSRPKRKNSTAGLTI